MGSMPVLMATVVQKDAPRGRSLKRASKQRRSRSRTGNAVRRVDENKKKHENKGRTQYPGLWVVRAILDGPSESGKYLVEWASETKCKCPKGACVRRRARALPCVAVILVGLAGGKRRERLPGKLGGHTASEEA